MAASDVPIEIGTARGEINKAAYFKPGLAPVRNPGSQDITVVYFMDYQCPACRKSTPDVARALKDEPKVRVIYRDTPIFGPRSEAAARVAIASQYQGKHEAMHHALMTAPMPLDEEALKAAAKKAGVNWARLQSDLDEHGKDIDLQIAWNMELAQSAGIAGTPAFIVGDVLANGVLDYEGLRAEIADARKAAQPAAASTTEPSQEPATAPDEKAPTAAEPAEPKLPAAAAPSVAFQQAPVREAAEEAATTSSMAGWLWMVVAFGVLASAAILIRKRFV